MEILNTYLHKAHCSEISLHATPWTHAEK